MVSPADRLLLLNVKPAGSNFQIVRNKENSLKNEKESYYSAVFDVCHHHGKVEITQNAEDHPRFSCYLRMFLPFIETVPVPRTLR